MPTVLFWPLDINHEVTNEAVEIRLWGKEKSGATSLVIAGLNPYFYLLPKKMENAQDVLKEVEGLQSRYIEIAKTEIVDKKYFGRPVKAIRVNCRTSEAMDKCSKLLGRLPSIKEHLEDDIRPATRYIIDNSVSPSGWYEFEVLRISRPDLMVDNVYEAIKQPKAVERLETPKIRVLGLSILCFSEKGSPNPAKDPILAISLATDPNKTEQLVSEGKNDGQLLKRFISRIRELDPDVIVGYGQNSLDWPYLIERSKKHKIILSVDRSGAEPHRSVYGHISVTGRANIDLADVSEEIPEVKVKTLGSVAEFLHVASRVDVDRFLNVETAELWRSTEKRKNLLEYSRLRAEVSIKVAELLLDFAIQLSNLTGLPLDQVAAAAVGFRVDSHLMMRSRELNELIPRRAEQPYIPYEGAIILEPKPGVHENVAVLDFTSMYPNLMIINNLSPDSFVGDEDLPPSEVVTAPEVGFKFRKNPPGFYRHVLENLISVRREIKAKLDKADPGSIEFRVLREREKAIKVITNACYGYAGWVGARWYVREVAESAAAFGRDTLKKVFKIAESLALPVIYGDTDAIFVQYNRPKVERLLAKVESEMGMEIKIDRVYSRVLFTEAKKKYAGLLPDGRLDAVGLEVVRGDWSNAAKTAQEKVLEIILKEKNARKAVQFLREFIGNLKAGKLPILDFAIWKTLTKPVDSYQVKAPHVEAAKTLIREGWGLDVGDKVGFVITKGSGKLYSRARPYMMATPEEVDFEYYVTNQVLPAAMRVLGMFGIDEDSILTGSGASALSDYIERR